MAIEPPQPLHASGAPNNRRRQGLAVAFKSQSWVSLFRSCLIEFNMLKCVLFLLICHQGLICEICFMVSAIFSQSMWALNRFGPCPAIGRRGVVAALGLYLYPSHELVWLIIFQMRALSKWKRYRCRQLSLVLKKHLTSSVFFLGGGIGGVVKALIGADCPLYIRIQ